MLPAWTEPARYSRIAQPSVRGRDDGRSEDEDEERENRRRRRRPRRRRQRGPKSGPLSLVPRFEDGGYGAEASTERRRWVERRTGAPLALVGSFTMPSEEMRGNVENPIGAAQVPLGVVGPLLIHGGHARGAFYVPLATTEGAMVRSYERGMVALTRAGGVTTRLDVDENRVSPIFRFAGVAEASAFAAEVEHRFDADPRRGRVDDPARPPAAPRVPAARPRRRRHLLLLHRRRRRHEHDGAGHRPGLPVDRRARGWPRAS